jgi:hypothetical protein
MDMSMDMMFEIFVEFLDVEIKNNRFKAKRRLELFKKKVQAFISFGKQNENLYSKWLEQELLEFEKNEKFIKRKFKELELQDYLLNRERTKDQQTLYVDHTTMEGITDDIYDEYREMQKAHDYFNPFLDPDYEDDEDLENPEDQSEEFHELAGDQFYQ